MCWKEVREEDILKKNRKLYSDIIMDEYNITEQISLKSKEYILSIAKKSYENGKELYTRIKQSLGNNISGDELYVEIFNKASHGSRYGFADDNVKNACQYIAYQKTSFRKYYEKVSNNSLSKEEFKDLFIEKNIMNLMTIKEMKMEK